jgi:hypothetical protein
MKFLEIRTEFLERPIVSTLHIMYGGALVVTLLMAFWMLDNPPEYMV